MDALFHRYGLLILAGLLIVASPGAWAQAPAAGRLVSVTGEVGIVGSDGVRRQAERGGDIREGDTIVTGDSALAQARMSDGSLISVRAESEFKLEQFTYKGREDRSASFVVNILKGGFRTITGLIAQVNRGGYRISTPAATIGVRGTHFEVVHVLPQIASPEVPAGTYNRVFEGITTVQNPAGAVLQVVREQTAFAALQGGTPTLVAPPALLFGRPTPVPRAAVPQGEDRAHKAAIKGESPALKMQDRAFKIQDRGLKSGTVRQSVPTTPLESTTTLRSVPISPIETTTIQLAPTTTTISPTLSTTTTTSPTLSTTTTISPTLSTTTTLSPTTTTTSPTLSTTTTISPTLSTTISPTTTTTTTTSPTTSTILQSPTTTTTTTIIQR